MTWSDMAENPNTDNNTPQTSSASSEYSRHAFKLLQASVAPLKNEWTIMA